MAKGIRRKQEGRLELKAESSKSSTTSTNFWPVEFIEDEEHSEFNWANQLNQPITPN
jgi:hypothetical protein